MTDTLVVAVRRLLRRLLLAAGVVTGGLSSPLPAQVTGGFDFTGLSLEELGTLRLSAASKRSQPLFETPAAVSVVLPQDVERSGFGNVADALRLVPGLHVAQSNNGRWAVGVRGFNGLSSTKLLVLVDGRTVYSPYYAGVDWQRANVHVADLARVEVVRGPGATLWGANAVNGIINVLSKDARETQGGVFSVRDGTAEDAVLYARYGGQAGEHTWYRVFAEAQSTRNSIQDNEVDGWMNNDQWKTGWRADSDLSENTRLTWQGEIARSEYSIENASGPMGLPQSLYHEDLRTNVLGRLVRRDADGGELTVQLYFDYVDGTASGSTVGLGEGTASIAEDGYSVDLDITHHWRVNEVHDLVWGGGLRRTFIDVDLGGSLQVQEPRTTEMLCNLFAQDEIALVPQRLLLTLGSKLEHHESVGWQTLPSARLAYLPSAQQTFWAAVSRAIRSPSRSERDSRLTFANIPATGFTPPMRIDLVGTSQFTEEELVAWEAGWRYRPTSQFTVEATTFVHDYDELRNLEAQTTFQPDPPLVINELHLVNNMAARGYGFEASAEWRVHDSWQLAARYAYERIDPKGVFEPSLIGPDYVVPRHTWSVNSWWELRRDLEFSCGGFWVDAVPELGGDQYFRVDAQLTWRPRLDLRLNLGVQNALDSLHAEYRELARASSVELPRNIFGSVEWRF